MRPSLLPFDPADLVALRVTRAQFARMVGVSKQSVTRWVREGVIALGPDGKLNPARASREVIERTDPTRLRARVFKQAVATHDELRQRLAELEAEAKLLSNKTEARITAVRMQERDAATMALGRFADAIVTRFDEAQVAYAAARLSNWLDELAAVEVYGMTLTEYRADLQADDTDACPDAPTESTR